MPEITALTPSTRRKGRVLMYVDGKFMASVDAMTIALYRLSVGQTVSLTLLTDVERDAVITRLVDRALRFLSFRPRSEAELRTYLRRQEATPDQVEAVLVDLRRQKLVDDGAFAQFWRESRDRFSPRGEGALRSELRAKGVASDIVAEVMPDADEEAVLAMRAAERQLRTIRALPWPDFRTKLLGYLQRRGFRYEVANRTARRLWGAAHGDEDEVTDGGEEE